MTQPADEKPPGSGQRHGCLTTWLVFIIITNPIAAVSYLTGGVATHGYIRQAHWAIFPLAAGLLANVVFAIALFRWKKWGFFGFVAVGLLGLLINLSILLPARNYGTALFSAAGVGLGIAILYWVLQMGKEKKAWSRLE